VLIFRSVGMNVTPYFTLWGICCKCLFYVVGIDVSAYFCVTIVMIR
jgi:hypothetical protein